MDKITEQAKILRKNATPQEQKLWALLKTKRYKNLKFKRQQPIGSYIVDFVCRDKWLIIELDGGQHNEEKNVIYDEKRTKYLETRGFKIIRFWNSDIDNNIEGVFEVIDKMTQ